RGAEPRRAWRRPGGVGGLSGICARHRLDTGAARRPEPLDSREGTLMAIPGRIVLKRKGMRELLRSPEVLADLKRRAESIAAAAGSGMEVSAMVGRNRARSSVITATSEARNAEATSRALTRAIDA